MKQKVANSHMGARQMLFLLNKQAKTTIQFIYYLRC